MLLFRQYNTGYEDGNYSIVACHLDGGGEIKSAMIREAQEEAGIEISPTDHEFAGVMHDKADEEYFSFFLTASQRSSAIINMEPHKCDDLSWFDLDDLSENTISYVRRTIGNYRNGVWFDSFGCG